MALAESDSTFPLFRVEYGDGRTFVFLSGEHDFSTAQPLRHFLAEAIATNDADLVVDLSEVEFMSATTVSVLVRARAFLQQHSRTLTARASSSQARHLLELCDLLDLIDE